jgi:hypothetical protein
MDKLYRVMDNDVKGSGNELTLPDCWQKEENKHKHPKGYNPGGANEEAGGGAVDNGSKVEFLLCGFTTESLKTFPDNQALLNDPNTWIGDTGATTHMKKSDSGMVNIQKASESDAVTMGNKQVEVTTKVRDIYGTICDKYGNEVSQVGLTNVSHVPGAGYNLFSLSRMIGKEGWKLVGDKNAIVIEKNAH